MWLYGAVQNELQKEFERTSGTNEEQIDNTEARTHDPKAKEYFNKVLELDPNDADVKKALNPTPVKAAPAKAATPKKAVKK